MFQTLKTWGETGGFAGGNPARLKAAIEFHEAFAGDGDHTDMVHPHDFEDAWPEEPQEVPDHFANPAQYQAWRNILISGLEALSGQASRKSVGLVEMKDPWIRVRDRCRERGFGSVHGTNLLALRRFALRRGIMPADVTQDWAEMVQHGLGKSERAMFRAGIGAFEKVRADPDIRGEFGLSEAPIGRLQCKPSPNEEYPLPPRLKADFEERIGLLAAGEPVGFRGRRRKPVAEATLRQYRFALAWFWRCFSVAFPDRSDPGGSVLARQDVLDEICRIADETEGLQLKPGIKKEYLGETLAFLQRWNPRLVQPEAGKKEKMKDEQTGKFVRAGRISARLAAMEAPEKFVAQAMAIEAGETELKGYLRNPALNGMIRFFELVVSRGHHMEFQECSIAAFLDDLDERSTGSGYWLRYANAMQEVAREMGYLYEIIDGFEVRLGPIS